MELDIGTGPKNFLVFAFYNMQVLDSHFAFA